LGYELLSQTAFPAAIVVLTLFLALFARQAALAKVYETPSQVSIYIVSICLLLFLRLILAHDACLDSRTHKKLPMKKEDEPDFYDTEKISPLPSLDESSLPPTSILPPTKRPMLRGGGVKPSLPTSLPTAPPGMGMDGRDPFLAMNPSLAMNARIGGLGPYGGMGTYGGMGGVGGPSGMSGMGLGGFGGFGGLGPATGLGHSGHSGHSGTNGIGAALRDSQMTGANLGMNNTGFMGNPSQLERIRRLQELEAMERHVLRLGQRR
jgi:hypothetical protein